MPTVQDNVTISTSWMEHQILEHVKQALRVTLDWHAPVVSVPRKLASLQFTSKSFARHLERLMSIEEEGGYMREVLEAKPNLQSQIDALANDHARFRARLHELLPVLSGLNEWDELRFHVVCEELRTLLDEIDEHDAKEVDLLEESLWTDEGGEG